MSTPSSTRSRGTNSSRQDTASSVPPTRGTIGSRQGMPSAVPPTRGMIGSRQGTPSAVPPSRRNSRALAPEGSPQLPPSRYAVRTASLVARRVGSDKNFGSRSSGGRSFSSDKKLASLSGALAPEAPGPVSPSADDNPMLRALTLARRGVALAHPNPMVGAVLVKNGRIIAEGFHTYDRRDHAEIVALKKAGKKARGATLYVTLEPCCTSGRTGPCTKAIIAAGIKNVYAAMEDPNPAVAGRGFAELKRAGIHIHLSKVFKGRAEALNEDFAKYVRTGLPFVTLKTALTLDGQIASRAGSTTWITSAKSLEEVQRLPHQAHALLTGISTVLAADPPMSDGPGEPRPRSLRRAIFDWRFRTPLRPKLVNSAEK